ncbi:condensation domain-containing protein [Microbacterium sp. NPDC096154]|uniref:condensation domain-containing protein n=1 Tax=Microbacterium sp. NPDC096154 TaxID=3155549 RepID=UPI00331A2365
MEYTELSAYDVPPGVVTTWVPIADQSAWLRDDRGLSPDQEAHLGGGDTGAWIGSVMRIPHRFDAPTLRAALVAWIDRHEALRSDVVADADGGGWTRRIVPARAVDIESTEIGWLGAGHSQRWIQDFFATVSPLRWPHLLFATVADPERDDFVLAFGADHSVMDAYSQLLWFEEFAGLYERAAAGATAAELIVFEVGSHVDHSERERAIAAALDESSAPVARWLEFLGEGKAFPRFPVPIDLDGRITLPQTSISVWLAGAEQTERLGAVCRDLGTSMQSGLLASVSVAFREAFGIDRLRYVLPMHTRASAEHTAAVGWYVGLAPIDIDITGIEQVDDLVAAVHAATGQGKDLVHFPFPRIAELGGIQDRPHFAISYVDTRFVPGADRWDEWAARALRSTSYAGDEIYFWFIRTREGLNVSARYPATLAAERAVRALLDRVGHHLHVMGKASAADMALPTAG